MSASIGSDGSTPRVSVLLPARNAAATLREAVDSILDQSLASLELIAVNDRSTDKTRAILEAAAARDPRVVIIDNPGAGLADGLNAAAVAARGAYLARMDADDIATPDRLGAQVTRLDRDTSLAALGTRYRFWRAEGAHKKGPNLPTDPSDVARALRSGEAPLAHPTMMIRADAFHAAGGYRRAFQYAQDIDLWLRLIERGPIANLAETGLIYRAPPPGAPAEASGAVKILRQRFYHHLALAASAARAAGERDPAATLSEPLGFDPAETAPAGWDHALIKRYRRTALIAERMGKGDDASAELCASAVEAALAGDALPDGGSGKAIAEVLAQDADADGAAEAAQALRQMAASGKKRSPGLWRKVSRLLGGRR